MIKPLPGYVLIDPSEAEETTTSGLHIPDNAKDRPVKGKLLAFGEYVKEEDAQIINRLEVGNTLIFKKWSGQDVRDGEKDLKLVKFEDLIGVID